MQVASYEPTRRRARTGHNGGRPDGGQHYSAHAGLFRFACGGEHRSPVLWRIGDPLRQVRGEGTCLVLGSSLLWFCTGRRVLLEEVGVKSSGMPPGTYV